MKFKKLSYWVIAISIIFICPIQILSEPKNRSATYLSLILFLIGLIMIVANKEFLSDKDK